MKYSISGVAKHRSNGGAERCMHMFLTVWVGVWGGGVCERDPPVGVEAVEWLLLASVPIMTTDDALERLAWYAARWGIEVWHKWQGLYCRIHRVAIPPAKPPTLRQAVRSLGQ